MLVRMIRNNNRNNSTSFVEFVDLLVVLLKSGRTTHQSLEAIARLDDGELRRAAEGVLRRYHDGERLADALSDLLTTFGASAVGIASCLAAAERDGLPIAPVLDRLISEAHAERRRSAQSDAAKLPVKLAFPLVVCVLPSFVALTVVPILIGALSSLNLGSVPH